MKKLQSRNIPDDLYDRVVASAESNSRSLEGEVRQALIQQYPAPGSEKLTLRQEWQQATAARLRGLVAQLKSDGFWQFRGPGSLVQLSQSVGESSPARFLDWLDGTEPMPFEAAERIARFTDSCTDWLMDGFQDPFYVADIGSPADYETFFSPDDDGDYRYHLIRFAGGRLFFIRHDRQSNSWTTGHTGGRFYLANGMGGGGTGNLKRFLQYLKTQGRRLKIDSHESPENDESTGQHHPCWFVKNGVNTVTDWLPQLLNGELPGRWAADAGDLHHLLDEFRDKTALVAYVGKLKKILETFSIYSDEWEAFNEGYIRRVPTCKATYDLLLEQLARVTITDHLGTLHNGTQEGALRRGELAAALKTELDFTEAAASEFVKGISAAK